MKKRYKISDINIEVLAPDDLMYDEDRALSDFRVKDYTEDISEEGKESHLYQIDKVKILSKPEGNLIAKYPGYIVYQFEDKQIRYIGSVEQDWENAYMRVEHEGYIHKVQLLESEYTEKFGAKTVLNAMAMEHLALEVNGIILHASYINHNGRAILFTAPSGTGKSTQAALWEEHRKAEIINGDRVLIRTIEGKAYASGIPFAGSSNYCKNVSLPIDAIVYLAQAPKTTIEKMSLPKAFRNLWQECTINTWNTEDVEKATAVLIDILKEIPVYYMPCTPDESAILALEDELKKL